MKETIVSFRTAKLAKDKGFNFITKQYYNSENPLSSNIELMTNSNNIGEEYCEHDEESGLLQYSINPYVEAPTHSELQQWLREKHNIYITVLPYRDEEAEVELCFYYTLVQDSEDLDDILCTEIHLGASDYNYDSYEDAFEMGLFNALKLLP